MLPKIANPYPPSFYGGDYKANLKKLYAWGEQFAHFKVDVPVGKKGTWEVSKFEIQSGGVDMMRAWRDGMPYTPGHYTRLTRGNSVVMSDTPIECLEHYAFAYDITGHVLVVGLGLGLMVKMALMNPDVEKITVVELDKNVIKLTGPTYTKDKRVHIVQGDAHTWRPERGQKFSDIWLDIWDDVCVDNLRVMSQLRRRYRSWCVGELRCWSETRAKQEARYG